MLPTDEDAPPATREARIASLEASLHDVTTSTSNGGGGGDRGADDDNDEGGVSDMRKHDRSPSYTNTSSHPPPVERSSSPSSPFLSPSSPTSSSSSSSRDFESLDDARAGATRTAAAPAPPCSDDATHLARASWRWRYRASSLDGR